MPPVLKHVHEEIFVQISNSTDFYGPLLFYVFEIFDKWTICIHLICGTGWHYTTQIIHIQYPSYT